MTSTPKFMIKKNQCLILFRKIHFLNILFYIIQNTDFFEYAYIDFLIVLFFRFHICFENKTLLNNNDYDIQPIILFLKCYFDYFLIKK